MGCCVTALIETWDDVICAPDPLDRRYWPETDGPDEIGLEVNR